MRNYVGVFDIIYMIEGVVGICFELHFYGMHDLCLAVAGLIWNEHVCVLVAVIQC